MIIKHEEHKKPIDRINVNKTSISCWKHEATSENKEYYTFNIRITKFNKVTKEFEKKTTMGIIELKDLHVAIEIMIQKYYLCYDKNNVEVL